MPSLFAIAAIGQRGRQGPQRQHDHGQVEQPQPVAGGVEVRLELGSVVGEEVLDRKVEPVEVCPCR